jgi:hypothetical protein
VTLDEEYQKKSQSDYAFCLCCNLQVLIAAWEVYDGESSAIVNGRTVDERALVYAMQELGHAVVI